MKTASGKKFIVALVLSAVILIAAVLIWAGVRAIITSLSVLIRCGIYLSLRYITLISGGRFSA